MKRKPLIALGALLAAIVMNSCAPPGGVAVESDNSRSPWNGPMKPSQSGGQFDMLPQDRRKAERPGLATGWGSEKKSEMNYVSFVRASSKPAGTDVIFYNNPEGIEAMAKSKSKVGPMQKAAGSMVEWGIKGRGGYLPAFKEYGFGRRLVAGKKDSTYTIVVKNRCKSALEIVASVDGLDVMDGKTAGFSKRGYIVYPGETLEIDGFRTSRSKVAAFEFSGVSNSYANLKHGDTRNVGVIGIAVFTRKGVNPWTWTSDEVNRRKGASAFAEAP